MFGGAVGGQSKALVVTTKTWCFTSTERGKLRGYLFSNWLHSDLCLFTSKT